jgi:Nuclease-related domain
MAGESAAEQARRKMLKAQELRNQAERLERAARAWDQGAAGERATAMALGSLPQGWLTLDDVRWPGRRKANIDHVVIGPGGIFVIDSKNWTGAVRLHDGGLRQNGYSRDKDVAAAADAALAVGGLVPEYAAQVRPVLCMTGETPTDGSRFEVVICSLHTLRDTLVAFPEVLSPAQVALLHQKLGTHLLRPEQRLAPTAYASIGRTRRASRRRSGVKAAAKVAGLVALLAFIAGSIQALPRMIDDLTPDVPHSKPTCSAHQRLKGDQCVKAVKHRHARNRAVTKG